MRAQSWREIEGVLLQGEFDQVGERLRSMTRDGSSIEAAQVKLIGLDEIREAAGPRWPRMRERVRSGSLNILSGHTGPDDILIPAGDGFLVLLAEGRPGDTQRRCKAMREALIAFYLGEDALSALRPEVTNRAFTAEGLSQLIATSMDEHSRFVAKAQNNEIALAPVLLAHEHRPGAVLAAPVAASNRGRRIAYNRDFILDGNHHGARQDYLELDLALLDAALNHAAARKQKESAGAVGVCVHASTMRLRRSREAYLHWLAGVDPALQGKLFVAIQEIERGTPLISIAEWTSRLRPHVTRIWLDFHYCDHAISGVGSLGVWAAGFHLPALCGARHAQRLRDQIGFWSKSLRAQGLRLVVHSFDNAELLDEANALGVDLLTSDPHWPFDAVEARVSR